MLINKYIEDIWYSFFTGATSYDSDLVPKRFYYSGSLNESKVNSLINSDEPSSLSDIYRAKSPFNIVMWNRGLCSPSSNYPRKIPSVVMSKDLGDGSIVERNARLVSFPLNARFITNNIMYLEKFENFYLTEFDYKPYTRVVSVNLGSGDESFSYTINPFEPIDSTINYMESLELYSLDFNFNIESPIFSLKSIESSIILQIDFDLIFVKGTSSFEEALSKKLTE